MNKLIKPRKPTKRQSPPSEIITVSKLLVFNGRANGYELIDHISHPRIFTFETGCVDDAGDVEFAVNDELVPNYQELDTDKYDCSHETLSYKQYQLIYEDCKIPSGDFKVIHRHNEDRYYENSIVQYEIADPDYNKKLEEYNNRFVVYEKQLAEYEVELAKYEKYRLAEKKRKLQAQLDNL